MGESWQGHEDPELPRSHPRRLMTDLEKCLLEYLMLTTHFFNCSAAEIVWVFFVFFYPRSHTHGTRRANAAAKWPHRWSQLLTSEHNRQADFSASKPKGAKGQNGTRNINVGHGKIPWLVTKQA